MPTSQSIAGDPVLEGKYHLERRLGQGGMGVVYKARHSYLKTLHAIKIILPDLVGNDPQLVTRFRQEALAAAAIRHQNVVSVSDYGVAAEKMPFLVMEYVEGESLHDLLAREQRLPVDRAFQVLSAICAGVGAAHHQGIVHRDLKPLNVMICSDKRNLSQAIKILDFGLAKIKSGELLGSFIQAQTTGLMGSPYYMAPEQWADEEPDARSDIYSLGVMLFQMLAGDVPFKGSSIPAIMKKHLSDPPPSFAELGVEIPHAIEAAVRHAIEKDRLARTQSVEQFVEEFQLAAGISGGGATGTLAGMSTAALPVSSISIVSDPAAASVFVDGIGVGQTKDDGPLLVEGIQTGNHRVKVARQGFKDWEADVFCDGKPQQVVARLVESGPGIPRPEMGTLSLPAGGSTVSPTPERTSEGGRKGSTGPGNVGASAQTKGKKGILAAIIGIIAILLVLGIGVIGYLAFRVASPGVTVTSDSGVGTQPPSGGYRNEMVLVKGGVFRMGRNDGPPLDGPEHEVSVSDFMMDKVEVTNGEYFEFIKDTGYPAPRHFENGRPLSGDSDRPVRFVSMDDVDAFVKWRSARDDVSYRLPTEQEWEYAARNGSAQNVYPWGDRFEEGRAVVDRSSTAPEMVASKSSGANAWGVLDLIGNVWEWTSSKPSCYPGNEECAIKETAEPLFMIRGGSAERKSSGNEGIRATTRAWGEASKRDATLGFRLVRNP